MINITNKELGVNPDVENRIVKDALRLINYQYSWTPIPLKWFQRFYMETCTTVRANPKSETMWVFRDRENKKFIVEYAPEYTTFAWKMLHDKVEEALKEKFNDMYKLCVEHTAIVFLHESLHPKLSHLLYDHKGLLKTYKKITYKALNVAADWEVDEYLRIHLKPLMHDISERAWEIYVKYSPSIPDEIEKDDNDPGNIFQYLRFIMKNPDKFSGPEFSDKNGEGEGDSESNSQSRPGGDNHKPMWGSMKPGDKVKVAGKPVDEKRQQTCEAALDKKEKEKAAEKKGKGCGTQGGPGQVLGSGAIRQKELNEAIHLSSFADLIRHFVKGKEYYSYQKIHRLNVSNVLPMNAPLPSRTLKPIHKSLFFLDTSGSMDFNSFRYVMSTLEQLLPKFGELRYVMCDIEIKKRGYVVDPYRFIQADNIEGGWGTSFEEPFRQLAEEGNTHIICYTDGDFPPFSLREMGLDPKNVIFLLVDCDWIGGVGNFKMGGIHVDLDKIFKRGGR